MGEDAQGLPHIDACRPAQMRQDGPVSHSGTADGQIVTLKSGLTKHAAPVRVLSRQTKDTHNISTADWLRPNCNNSDFQIIPKRSNEAKSL